MEEGIKSNPKIQGNNEKFQSFVYGTHVPAYSKNGLLKELPLVGIWDIGMTPDIIDDVLTIDGMTQVIQIVPELF